MNKKSLILVRIIMFVLTMTILCSGIASDGMNIREKIVEDNAMPPYIYVEQINALKAYSLLESCFELDENGNIVYPSNFSGAWIDSGLLHIAVPNKRGRTERKVDYENKQI